MRKHRWRSSAAQALCREEATDDPVEAMRHRATALLDRSEQGNPPVNLALIASFRGIGKIESLPMREAGRLIHRSEGSVVQVNAGHSPGKQNFSIAHEICHALLPGYSGQGPGIKDKETGEYNPSKEEEYLCDIGASALILDRRWLIPCAIELGPSIVSLLTVSKQAVASLQASAVALTDIDLWPCAIVFWEEGWRKKERPNPNQIVLPQMEALAYVPPELRVAFPCTSQSFGLYVPKNKSVGRTTSIYECLESTSSTARVEKLDFGKGDIGFSVESVYAPYKRNGVPHKRVVSFILSDHTPVQGKRDMGDLYSMELL